MKGLRIALGFLTRLPGPRAGEPAAGAGWFPLAGAAVGGVAALASMLAWLLFPGPIPAAAAVAASLWAGGGLHLDGLMDVADALGSGAAGERLRAILHDSRVGAMGAMAGALALILRFALYAAVPWQGMIVAAAVARWGIVFAARCWGRGEGGGLGSAFAAGLGRWAWAGALLLAVVLAAALGRWRGLAALLATSAVTALLAPALRRRLGSLSGDALGTLAEVGEWTALAVMAARLR